MRAVRSHFELIQEVSNIHRASAPRFRRAISEERLPAIEKEGALFGAALACLVSRDSDLAYLLRSFD